MYRDHTVAAVVPAYNEAGFVGEVVADLPAFLDRAYVVDDGSTDETWAEIRREATARNDEHDGRFERLVVPIQHDQNRGVGGAIKTGYQRAREESIDVTVVLGGDAQMDPDELTRYIDPIVEGTAEYTKGNRFARPEDRAGMPRKRLVGNVVLSYLTKIASGYWGSMDSQNGYTAISHRALRETDIDGMYEYYGYCNDLLVRLNVAGMPIADVPRSAAYAYTDGWKSHIDYAEYVPRVSGMLFRSFVWRLNEKYLLQRYEPLALFYLAGMAVLGVGSTGLAATLARRDRDAGSWLVSTVLGGLIFVYATLLDREDNADLEAHLDPAVAPAEDDDRTADTAPAGRAADPNDPDRHDETARRGRPDRADNGDRPGDERHGDERHDSIDSDSTDSDPTDSDPTDSDPITTPTGDTDE